MTAYVVFEQLKSGRLTLEDLLPVSEKAWRKGGSKMFVEVGSEIRVEDLLRGVIIQSGNDASIVLAEGLAGSEDAFADVMTSTARELGMPEILRLFIDIGSFAQIDIEAEDFGLGRRLPENPGAVALMDAALDDPIRRGGTRQQEEPEAVVEAAAARVVANGTPVIQVIKSRDLSSQIQALAMTWKDIETAAKKKSPPTAELRMVDDRGNPICATIRPENITWRL